MPSVPPSRPIRRYAVSKTLSDEEVRASFVDHAVAALTAGERVGSRLGLGLGLNIRDSGPLRQAPRPEASS